MSGSRHTTGLTPSAQRTVARCRRLAADSVQPGSWASFLVLTLLQDESLASACLIRHGITQEWLVTRTLGAEVAQSAANALTADSTPYSRDAFELPSNTLDGINDPLEFSSILDRATDLARRGMSDAGVSSAHLLLAIVETNKLIRDQFAAAGATLQTLRDELYPEQSKSEPPIQVDDCLEFNHDAAISNTPVTANALPLPSVWRILDANLNRGREGLRVLEDFARFLANDERVSLECKTLRHELVTAEKQLFSCFAITNPGFATLEERDTTGDVGTSLSTEGERNRPALTELVTANNRRVQESLRSLEEYGKLVSDDFAAVMKQLRYRAYTLEKMMSGITPLLKAADGVNASSQVDGNNKAVDRRRSRLESAQVYVLITESLCRLPWKHLAEQALAGGADVLQLREKCLNDRELLRRATWLREACRAANALFIMNDRPDVAVASKSDGVHVGQDEFLVSEARQILRSGQLIGVSTHNPDQALQAMIDGADYLGVGPVFPSRTKSFDAFPGLPFVKAVSSTVRKPWFTIGGVTLESLSELMEAGSTRVAVTSAVAGADEPAAVVREFKRRLANDQSSNAERFGELQ